MAQPTEDHPLGYADFEGVIPEGQYGAGTVLVWDAGPYRNLREKEGTPMEEALEEGKAEVWLEGEKLRGAIKSALMNQQVLAGIGNIYADELLFQAGVHPKVHPRELETERLFCEAFRVCASDLSGHQRFFYRPVAALRTSKTRSAGLEISSRSSSFLFAKQSLRRWTRFSRT